MSANCDHLKKLIREVPDFPKKGILFYDITTLLKDKVGFATLIDALSEHYLMKRLTRCWLLRPADSFLVPRWLIA